MKEIIAFFNNSNNTAIFLVFINVVLFLNQFVLSYLNYPANNSTFNILLGSFIQGAAQTFLIDLACFIFFLFVIYLPYRLVKLFAKK